MVLFSFNKFSVILSYHPTVSFLETHLKKKKRETMTQTLIYTNPTFLPALLTITQSWQELCC